MNSWRRVGSVFDKIVVTLAVVAAVLLIFAMLAVDYGVVMRYFVQRSQAWVMEIAAMCLVYIAFLATTWLLRKEGHVTMDLATVLLKPRSEAIINVVTSLICALMFLLFTVYGTYVTWDHYVRGLYNAHSVLRLPTAYLLVIVPVGCFFLFIQLLRRAWASYLLARGGSPEPEKK